MSLNNLTPAKGSVKKEKELPEGKEVDMAELQLVVIKEPNLDQVTKQKSDLKVVKCLYSVVYPNLDLKI